MTFQEAIQALETVDHHLNAIHFRKRHQGSCIRQACKDAMVGFNRALDAVREAYRTDRPQPILAYFMNGSYRDTATAEVLSDHTGLYVYYHDNGASLMYTWKDSYTGNPATACIDPSFIRTLYEVRT